MIATEMKRLKWDNDRLREELRLAETQRDEAWRDLRRVRNALRFLRLISDDGEAAGWEWDRP